MSGAKRRTTYSTPQSFTFTLKVSGLVGCAVGLVVLLSSFFALGVVVGRGYQPEAAVPELARLIPTPQGVESEDESSAESSSVLKPEELQYMDRLKKGGTPPASHAEAAKPAEDKGSEAKSESASATSPARPEPAKRAEPEPAPAAVAKKPAPAATTRDQAAKLADRIERTALNAPSAAPAAAPSSPASTSTSVAASAEDEDQTVYDYIYQAASFKEKSMAEAFREKIAALGLGAAIQQAKSKSTTWYRVVVHFQGRPGETREMKAKLKSLGVNRPIMQSKKPLQEFRRVLGIRAMRMRYAASCIHCACAGHWLDVLCVVFLRGCVSSARQGESPGGKSMISNCCLKVQGERSRFRPVGGGEKSGMNRLPEWGK